MGSSGAGGISGRIFDCGADERTGNGISGGQRTEWKHNGAERNPGNAEDAAGTKCPNTECAGTKRSDGRTDECASADDAKCARAAGGDSGRKR